MIKTIVLFVAFIFIGFGCSKNIRKIENPEPTIKVKHKGKIISVLLEEYVANVLAGEVSPHWPLEALKAQAIAARTFALKKMEERKGRGFHIASSTLDQVFRNHNQKIFTKAAKDTKGQIIIQNEKIAESSFHSTCGGHTANAKAVWGTAHKHLAGTECGYCEKSPSFSWSYEMPLKDLEKIFGHKISSIKLLDRNKDGRLESILLSGPKKTKISANGFRKKIGSMKIKSTNIAKAELKKNKVTFYGHGFGHGVGLCQYGALGMAEEGFLAPNIISYYYPTTKIEKIY